MKCKVFTSRRRKDLEDSINAWLEKNPVGAGAMHLQYGAVCVEDPDSYIVEHTLIMFYEPMEPLHSYRPVQAPAQAVFEATPGRDVKYRP